MQSPPPFLKKVVKLGFRCQNMHNILKRMGKLFSIFLKCFNLNLLNLKIFDYIFFFSDFDDIFFVYFSEDSKIK